MSKERFLLLDPGQARPSRVPMPPVVAVKDGQVRVIVRRETEEDLLATDLG